MSLTLEILLFVCGLLSVALIWALFSRWAWKSRALFLYEVYGPGAAEEAEFHGIPTGSETAQAAPSSESFPPPPPQNLLRRKTDKPHVSFVPSPIRRSN
jgi:hypothetical protein